MIFLFYLQADRHAAVPQALGYNWLSGGLDVVRVADSMCLQNSIESVSKERFYLFIQYIGRPSRRIVHAGYHIAYRDESYVTCSDSRYLIFASFGTRRLVDGFEPTYSAAAYLRQANVLPRRSGP